MRSVTVSWQNALVAIATMALLGLVVLSVRAGAEEKPRPDKPAAAPKDKPASDRPRREGEEGHRDAERKIPMERRDAPDRPRREGEGRREPGMDARARELTEHRARLEEKIRDLEQRLRELPKDRDGEARELHQNLERVRAEHREISAALASLRRPEGERGPQPGPGGPREEIERRMHHVRVAVENLHAAGLHEQADRVAHEAEQAILRGPREGGQRPHGEPGPAHHPEQRPPHAPGPPQPFAGPDGVPPVIHELAAQMQDLRRQVQELREQLQRSRGEGGPRR